jgi:transposase-like protein
MEDYKDENRLRQMYKENSIRDISDQLDVSTSTIYYWMDKHDIETDPHPKDKPLTPHVKAGDSNNGYEVWQTNINGSVKTVKHHRLLAVAEYGLEKVKDKNVHHINEIPWDNRVDNIKLMSRKNHGIHHAKTQAREENGNFK